MSYNNSTSIQAPIRRPKTTDTEMIVEPAIGTFSDVNQSYLCRYNGFAPNQTLYIFERPLHANRVRFQLEDEGYSVHITYPDDTTYSTNAKIIHSGILLASSKDI